ncbi:MAG: hypothetical protein JWN40_897, partial [Phycisphaerales bacterium]|nr:hypothetical protein [Phycisphaerales bacterium]
FRTDAVGISLVQVTADGKPDATFAGGAGFVRGDIFGGDDAIASIAIDALGRTLLLHTPAQGQTAGAVARFRANGTFDRSFGTRGVRQLDIAADNIAFQSDGHIVLAGTQLLPSGGRTTRSDVERLNSDGSVDASFGVQGVAQISLPSGGVDQYPYLDPHASTSVAILGDGRIAIAGGTGPDISVAALTPSGLLDLSFGVGGIADKTVSGPGTDYAKAIVVQPDGAYVVGGSSAGADGTHAALTRYHPNGSPDLAFGKGGQVRFGQDIGTEVRALAVAAGGKLLALTDQKVIRLNADGSIDRTFGSGGSIMALSNPIALAVTTHGRFVVVSRTGAGSYNAQIQRYNADGSLDLSFASRGTFSLPGVSVSSPNSLLIQASGAILLAGVKGGTNYPTNPSLPWAVYRITSQGLLDQTFGQNGMATINVGGSGIDAPFAIDVVPDGQIVVAGRKSTYYGFGSAYAVARLTPTGQVDATFADQGVALDGFPPSGLVERGAYASAVRVQSDGKILVLGPTHEQVPPVKPPSEFPDSLFGDWGILRYNVDGTLDNDFGTSGQVTTSFGWGDTPQAALLTADAKLIVAGTGQPFDTDADFAIARYILTDPHPITARLQNRVLTITGTAANDVIRLRIQSGLLSVAGLSQSYPTSAFSRIAINGDAGNDTLDASAATVPVTLTGGDGNDLLLGGAYADLLQGDAGNDTLFGGQGNDTLHGNDGNDYLSGGPGADQLFGDAGNDQLVALDHATDTLDGGAGFDRARGDASDLLTNIEGVLA